MLEALRVVVEEARQRDGVEDGRQEVGERQREGLHPFWGEEHLKVRVVGGVTQIRQRCHRAAKRGVQVR